MTETFPSTISPRLLAPLRVLFVIVLVIAIPGAAATGFVMIISMTPNDVAYASTLLVVANLIGPTVWFAAFCSALEHGLWPSTDMASRDRLLLHAIVDHAFKPWMWLSYVATFLIIKTCAV